MKITGQKLLNVACDWDYEDYKSFKNKHGRPHGWNKRSKKVRRMMKKFDNDIDEYEN